MRNKIDFGIDLGTTNSAIARMVNGEPTIVRSDLLTDTIPSCVHYNRKQDCWVGGQALNAMKNDNSRALQNFDHNNNTFIEFKRTMGKDYAYECFNTKRTYTSEELSAEVLMKLKSFVLDEPVPAVVITVPAQFLNQQKDATLKAAQLAGFKHVELLQEPVAAATAFGLNSQHKDGYWLVFDFGGGTFDTALVKTEDGILSVKDTAGDNWLGGKNLDEAIVDQFIIPYLKKNYEIDFVIDDSDKLQILRKAVKPYAEEAKNQLSFKQSVPITTNLGDLPLEDEDGNEIEIDITITRDDVKQVFAPFLQKAIDITKELLKRNHLQNNDLDKLILVGGPTHSSILREMLKEQITPNVDNSVDPMTAVAKGAALFASTISVSEEVKDECRDKKKIQLDLNYEAASVEKNEPVSIALHKENSPASISGTLKVEIVRTDGAWASPQKVIGDKKVLLEVDLKEGTSNQFEIRLYDVHERRIECEPNQFTILQGISGLDNMTVLPYNICIVKHFAEYDQDLIQPVKGLEKNKRVPATGVCNGLKTRCDIRPGKAEDIIRIPIYQGQYDAEGTDPLLNDMVYEVIISGENIPKLLPKGSDVDITIKVDRSEQMFFTADFPAIEYTEEVNIEIKQQEPPTEELLRKELQIAKRKAREFNAKEIELSINTLEKNLENERGSADGKFKILDYLRKDLMILSKLEKNAEWPKIEGELKEAFFSAEKLVQTIINNHDVGELDMNKVKTHLEQYRQMVDAIIRDKNVKEAKALLQDINAFDFNLRNAVTGNSGDVDILHYLDQNFNSLSWSNKIKARELINKGLQMANAGHTGNIRSLLIELRSLLPDDEHSNGTLE